jgi:hypothetical protein
MILLRKLSAPQAEFLHVPSRSVLWEIPTSDSESSGSIVTARRIVATCGHFYRDILDIASVTSRMPLSMAENSKSFHRPLTAVHPVDLTGSIPEILYPKICFLAKVPDGSHRNFMYMLLAEGTRAALNSFSTCGITCQYHLPRDGETLSVLADTRAPMNFYACAE